MQFYDQLKSTLERYLLRSTFYQLLAVAALIGLVTLVAGALVYRTVPDAGTLSESTWWAFLRLTDPGYLGDDEGALRRVISTIVTILGYVLFMGSLVAIMTQWLNSNMRRLESGYTAIRRNNHILILGWTSRAGIVLSDLLQSERRVRRFLRLHGTRRLHIVILAETVSPALMQEVKSRAGKNWDPNQITLRSGTALRGAHLKRVDYLNASAILLPAGEFTSAGPGNIDTHTIKALLSLNNHPEIRDRDELPMVVAEVLDERKAEIARSAYTGPIEVLASDTAVSRLVAQNVRHPGLSSVYSELLTHRLGNEIFLRSFPELSGLEIAEVYDRFPQAIVIGILEASEGGYVTRLNCSGKHRLGDEDRLVLVARDYDETEPAATRPPPSRWEGGEPLTRPAQVREVPGRILILGWSHKLPRLIAELFGRGGRGVITVASALPIAQRRASIERYIGSFDDAQIEVVEVDYTNERELSSLAPDSFDSVILLGSDWLDSREESDARTIVGYLVLQRVLERSEKRPHILVELLDSENVDLLGERPGDVLISPVVLSHMLAQVALRRELMSVFDRLFAARGAEITFRTWAECGLPNERVSFIDVLRIVFHRVETAMGIVRLDERGRREIHLNPPRELTFDSSEAPEIVVVADELE